MYSKNIFFGKQISFLGISLSAMIVLSLVGTGCARENIDYYEIPDIRLKGSACLTNAVANFKLYISSKSTYEEAAQIWPCFSYALNTFRKIVKGNHEGYYEPEEIRQFIETYFLNSKEFKGGDKNVISDNLLYELMGLKTLFLGGSRTRLTQKEMLATFTLIERFNEVTLRMHPFTDVVFGKLEAGELPRERFEVAMSHLDDSLGILFRLMAPESQSYDVSSMKNLLAELGAFFSKVGGNSGSEFDWAKYVPALAQAKSIMLHSSNVRIDKGEWSPIGKIISRAFKIGLNFHYFMDSDFLSDKAHLVEFERLIRDIQDIVFDAFESRGAVPIAESEMAILVDELGKIDLLPFDLDGVGAMKIWNLVSEKVLNPQGKFVEVGLGVKKWNYLVREFESWLTIQYHLFDGKAESDDPRWGEMKSVLSGPFSVDLDDIDRVVLNGGRKTESQPATTRLNWSRALFSALFKAYIKDPGRLNKMMLSEDELKVAYEDLKEVLVAIGLVNRGDSVFYKKLKRDADLFMPRSNGNGYVEFVEVVEYLHFALAGIDAGKFFVALNESGCKQQENKLDVRCFRKSMVDLSQLSMEHLPLYLGYARRLNNSDWNRDINNMEIVNRSSGASGDPIKYSEIYETFVMLQYIEVIMLNYDLDRSGDLDLKEVINLLKLFKGILKDLIGLDYDQNPDEVEATFTYMFKYGENPLDLADRLAILKYNDWKFQRESWKLAADRSTMLKILAFIAKLKK